MSQDDLTSVERRALELLRANAPDAPEALANLDETGRARVLEALSAGTGARESDDPVAAVTDNEPTLEGNVYVSTNRPDHVR